MTIEVADPRKLRRPPGLDLLVLLNQKPPLLQVVAFNRPVKAIVAHRVRSSGGPAINELSNLYSNDGYLPLGVRLRSERE